MTLAQTLPLVLLAFDTNQNPSQFSTRTPPISTSDTIYPSHSTGQPINKW